jgi:hypothetical protein
MKRALYKLKITKLEAEDLKVADFTTSDPFQVHTIDDVMIGKTEIIFKNHLDPKWESVLDCLLKTKYVTLNVDINDFDECKDNDTLGKFSMDLYGAEAGTHTFIIDKVEQNHSLAQRAAQKVVNGFRSLGNVFSGTKTASRCNSLNPSKSVVRFHIDFERDPGVVINQTPIVDQALSFNDRSKLPATYQEAISFYLNENPMLDPCCINDIIADVLSLRKSTSRTHEKYLICNSLVFNMETSTMITYEEKILTFRPYEQQEGNSIYLNFFLEDVKGDGTHSKLLFKTFENRFEMWSVLKDLLFQFQESEVNNWLKVSRSKIMPETGFEIPKSHRTGVEAEVVSIVVSLDSITLTDFVAQVQISCLGTDKLDDNQHCMVHGPVHSDRNILIGDTIAAVFNLKNGRNNFEVEHSDGQELLSFNLVCDGTEAERIYEIPESNLQGKSNESFRFVFTFNFFSVCSGNHCSQDRYIFYPLVRRSLCQRKQNIAGS